MSKLSLIMVLAAVSLVILNAGLGFVAPSVQTKVTGVTHSKAWSQPSQGLPESTTTTGTAFYGVAMVATAAGVLLRARRTSRVARNDGLHGIKFPYALQKDAHADLEYLNDVGYLPDGTPLNMAGNCINHPETIQPDSHSPGSPLPRANLRNSIGYLPDGTPMNAAGNALNHPETMQPDMHTPGSPLPSSVYAADVGYLVDGTDLATAGNNSVKAGAPATPAATPSPAPPQPVAAAFVGSSAQTGTTLRKPSGFLYSVQRDAYADLTFCNDVGYLPDGTPMNKAGNCLNHPENIQPDPHAPGSPLPRAIFVNDVGYLPDGTPMNRAGNAINHPETIGPDAHSPGAALPASEYAADIGYLVDGTPLDAAGNNTVH